MDPTLKNTVKVYQKICFKRINRGDGGEEDIEGVFGGLKNKRLLFTIYRKESMRYKHIIAMEVVDNISCS